MIVKSVDGKSIFYEVHGDVTSLRTIVFLNGLSQTTKSWGLMAPFFLNFRLVFIDFIFQGSSDQEGEMRDFNQHAQDVLSVMDHLAIPTPILIGLSYGSLVAQNYAVNYPNRVEKLVLLSTFAHKTPYYEAIELSWSRALEIGGYSLMLDVMMPFVLSDNYFQNPLIPVELLKSARKEMIEAVSLRKLMEATEKRPDYRKELEKIKVSTLVIHGDSDTLFSVDLGRQVANSIPNALFVVIPRTGHTLNLESVHLVNTEVSKFLN